MEQAPNVEFLIAQSLKRHRPIPEKIANMPERLPWLEIHWECFRDVSRDRQGRDGFIPWSSMYQWAQTRELDAEETRRMLRIVGGLDLAYVQWIRQHAAKQQSGEQ